MSGAKVLLRWRTGLKLTQMQMAGRLGVSQSALCEWERGKAKPSLSMALRLERESDGIVAASAWEAKRRARPSRRAA
jgi:transcriptional regulator with XRE-family HTH domain